MTESDKDSLEFFVRKRSEELQAYQVPDAIYAVVSVLANELNHVKNTIFEEDRFSRGWLHREMSQEDRDLMNIRGITEIEYRAEMYVQCLLITIAQQFKTKDK